MPGPMSQWNPQTGAWEDPEAPAAGPTPTLGELAAQGTPLPVAPPAVPSVPLVSPSTGAPLGAPPAPALLAAPAAPPPAAPAAGDELPLTKTQTQTTVTSEHETAAEKKVQKEQAANEAQARANLQARQKLDEVVQDEKNAAAAANANRTAKMLDAHGAELTRLKSVSAAEESKYKQQLTDFSNPRNGYFADMTTPDKISAGVSLLLGLVGGLTDGSNVGADRIIKAVDADTAKRRMLLEAQERIVERAKGDVGNARAELAHQKDMLDLRSAVGLEMAVAQARSRAARLGIDEANLRNNEQLQKLENEALERRQKHEEGLRSKATVSSLSVAGGAAAGGKPTENQTRLALLGTSMLDELKVIKPEIFTPALLSRMQRQESLSAAGTKAAQKGVFGAVGVGFARMLGLPQSKYEGLTPQQEVAANAVDNALEKYTRLLTGAGMPIDEAVRMALQSAPHAGDSPSGVASKLARLDSEARRMVALSGQAGVTAGRVERAATPTGAPAAAPPAGGKRVRLKDGRVGTLFPDGNFQAE